MDRAPPSFRSRTNLYGFRAAFNSASSPAHTRLANKTNPIARRPIRNHHDFPEGGCQFPRLYSNLSPLPHRLLLALVLLAGAVAAEQLQVDLVTQDVIQKRLAQGVVKENLRQGLMEELFEQSGCKPVLQKVRGKWNNVICTLPGQTDSVIAIGGHYDFADHGQGIIDDWSGSSLLPSIFHALKTRPRRHTFVFIGFALEETGLVGSSYYAGHLGKEDRARYRAYVNLDCVGLGPLKVWMNRSDPALAQRMAELASAMKIPVSVMNVDKVGDDDTHPFLDVHIPVLSLHSITQSTFPLLHTKNDKVDAISPADHYDAYRLAAFYLAYLDAKLD